MRFLKGFEKKYAEYLEAKKRREEEGPEIGWSAAQLEAREEELKGLALQAEAAINVAGVGRVVVYDENFNTGDRYPVTDNLRTAMFGPEENFGMEEKAPTPRPSARKSSKSCRHRSRLSKPNSRHDAARVNGCAK